MTVACVYVVVRFYITVGFIARECGDDCGHVRK